MLKNSIKTIHSSFCMQKYAKVLYKAVFEKPKVVYSIKNKTI